MFHAQHLTCIDEVAWPDIMTVHWDQLLRGAQLYWKTHMVTIAPHFHLCANSRWFSVQQGATNRRVTLDLAGEYHVQHSVSGVLYPAKYRTPISGAAEQITSRRHSP